MSWDRCPTCDEYASLGTHHCEPMWLVWELEHHEGWEDAARVHSHRARDAAEKYAEESDVNSADYTIVSGSPATVRVRAAGEGGSGDLLLVSGESIPQYTAQDVRSLRCPRCAASKALNEAEHGDRCCALTSDGTKCPGRLEASVRGAMQ